VARRAAGWNVTIRAESGKEEVISKDVELPAQSFVVTGLDFGINPRITEESLVHLDGLKELKGLH